MQCLTRKSERDHARKHTQPGRPAHGRFDGRSMQARCGRGTHAGGDCNAPHARVLRRESPGFLRLSTGTERQSIWHRSAAGGSHTMYHRSLSV